MAEEFIIDSTKNYCNEKRITVGKFSHWEKQPWLTPNEARRAVEIAREEMMERACKWLQCHHRVIDGEVEDFIWSLKQAMKDE